MSETTPTPQRPTELPPHLRPPERPKRFPRTRRWLFNFTAALSAFFCLAAMVLWGFGIGGKGVEYFPPYFSGWAVSVYAGRGSLGFEVEHMLRGSSWEETQGFRKSGRIFYRRPSGRVLESIDFAAEERSGQFGYLGWWYLQIPYWLLILVFALAPVLRLRRRYVERWDKKFFEEIVAAKRAEQDAKE